MRSAVALLLVASTVASTGCFPHDPHKRTIAQIAEGGAVVGGIVLEALLQTGADCDMMTKPGMPPDPNCRSHSSVYGGIGVALILGGLLGFVATISTAEDPKEPPKIDIKAPPTNATTPTPSKAATTPPTDGTATPTSGPTSGSDATSPK